MKTPIECLISIGHRRSARKVADQRRYRAKVGTDDALACRVLRKALADGPMTRVWVYRRCNFPSSGRVDHITAILEAAGEITIHKGPSHKNGGGPLKTVYTLTTKGRSKLQ